MSQFCFGAWSINGTAKFISAGRVPSKTNGSTGVGEVGVGIGEVELGMREGAAGASIDEVAVGDVETDDVAGRYGVATGIAGCCNPSTNGRQVPREAYAPPANRTKTTPTPRIRLGISVARVRRNDDSGQRLCLNSSFDRLALLVLRESAPNLAIQTSLK